MGDEDCLFMDITVPGGVDPTKKKPVMMFIYGGGYLYGSKDIYLGASLAKHGDVIVVTINYRLGALGFLYDGPGTGNFALWDQRAALVWIQNNIQRFGGDPDLVTIFGESAGSGSVSAQLIGQHNDGLFKRGIQESGSLYIDGSWYTSERQWKEVVESIKRKTNCPSSESVYDCLSGLSVKEVYAVLPPNDILNVWHPMPDNDFFSPDAVNEDYTLSRRYFNSTTAKDKPLADTMMTMWTNFAKTGNPNRPVSLPSSVPEWPEFDSVSNQFMELGIKSRVVTTPNKERLELLKSTVLEARKAQVLADKGTDCSDRKQITSPADAVVG
ncbi:acetylcholinesterase-like [Watersipora subatra]|uniref:acetylcholinesterase-like n=1 Tax=Watersipora subatra TaxID=2589382 RepID=UPI00355AD5FF